MTWRSQAIFVSSTFGDMQAERDFLRSHVFPEIEERLRRIRVHLEWVDLRIGIAISSIADQSDRDAEVLKVCLAEVERCRPFFIALIGDRYGSVADSDRIAAAAREAGLEGDYSGCSITELEIAKGVLADVVGATRSLIYLRAALPYQRMRALAGEYSDLHHRSAEVRAGATRLASLKSRLRETLPGRVHEYHCDWDDGTGTVIGLEGWGADVVEQLWQELHTAFPPVDDAGDASWQDAERRALIDFVEDRCRDFTGREGVITRLMGVALQATSDLAGICLTGVPGSGKSAIWCALYQRLAKADALILAHVAGASLHSHSVDSMLRRWCDELAARLGESTGLSGDESAGAIDAAFAALLRRAAQRERVVVLIDALDQLEPTARARFSSWLPRDWPANARLIATTVSGDCSSALAERPGMEMLPLGPLALSEARQIVERIGGRYHRRLEPEVIASLLGKGEGDGFGWRSPLWLVLASEEIHLVDADDFARAKRDYQGDFGERLRDLLVDIVASMPSDVAGLYRSSFERAADRFGAPIANTMLALLAAGRSGWRDSDFGTLIAELTKAPCPARRLALVRQNFRGQLYRHGESDQLDVRHAEMRIAARRLLPQLIPDVGRLHATIATYLLTLSEGDPVRERETMYHLLRSPNKLPIEAYLGDESLSEEALRSGVQAIADVLLEDSANGIATLRRAIQVPSMLGAATSITAARRILYLVDDRLSSAGASDARRQLCQWLADVFGRLLLLDQKALLANDRGAALARLGDIELAEGNIETAEHLYKEGLAMALQISAGHGDVAEWRRDLSVSHNKIGDIHRRRGNFAAAERSYRDALEIMTAVVAQEPDNWEWQRDVAFGHFSLGELHALRKDYAAAISSHTAAVTILQPLVEQHSQAVEVRWDLAASLERLGDSYVATAELHAAEAAYRASLALRETLNRQRPDNIEWRHGLATIRMRLSQPLGESGRTQEADAHLRQAARVLSELVNRDPGNMRWCRDCAVCLRLLAQASLSAQALGDADEACRTAVQLLQACQRPTARHLSLLEDELATFQLWQKVEVARGDLREAQRCYLSMAQLEREIAAAKVEQGADRDATG